MLFRSDLLDVTFNRPRTATENEIRMGVEFDVWGRRIAYYFIKPNLNMMVGLGIASNYSGDRERIPAEQILHIFKRQQAGQTRGVPPMSPSHSSSVTIM